MRQFGHRNLKDFITRHRQIDRVFRFDAIGIRQRQQFAVAPIRMQMRRDNARLFRSAQHNGASAIAKNNDGSAIGRIAGARQHVSANHQSVINRAVFHVLIGNAERVGETRAGRSNVKRRAAFDTQH